MINHFLPYVILPSFHVHPKNYTRRRGRVRVDTVDLVNYCDIVISTSYENRIKTNSCYVKKKAIHFDDHLTTRHDPDVYTVKGPWVYIGQCKTIEWIISYYTYILLRSGLMMSKGHVIVTSRGREK